MAWLVLVTVGGVVALLAWNAAPPLAAPGAASSPRAAPTRVLVVFATMAGEELLLDCVGPAGEPFALRVEVDCSAAYAGAFVESIVSKWATTGEPVALEVVDGVDGRAVRLSGDGSRVQLPLAA